MLRVGSFIAGYRVERLLGTGGMGAVYLVANPELPRREALKLLSAELSRDAGFRARFVREAQVAARLEHPNIVSIYRRGETPDGQLWIAMQFVDGIDADAALARGQVSPQRAIHIVGEVGKALDYAHRHNVIHRDVKPANFLLSGPIGGEERVLLGDFGIARALDDASVTGTGTVLATLAYAAPEVIASQPVDGRADIYSLGCALFKMLTGKAPFAEAQGAAAVMMAHLMQPPPRVSEKADWLPSALDAVIATAMAKDPAQRFASGAQLAAAANEALRSPVGCPPAPLLPPGPPPVPSAQQHPPLPRRSFRSKVFAALAAVAIVAAVTITAIAWPSSESSRPTPTAPSTTSTTPSSTAPPISAAALPGLLLGPDELSGITGIPMQTLPITDVMADDTGAVSVRECVGAFWPGESTVYAESGWTAVRQQTALPQPGQGETTVVQAVVAFPSVAMAWKFLGGQSIKWHDCASRSIAVDTGAEKGQWTFGQSDYKGGMVTLTASRAGDNRSCGRVLSIRDNIVIDVQTMLSGNLATQTPDATAQSVAIANKVASKVSR